MGAFVASLRSRIQSVRPDLVIGLQFYGGLEPGDKLVAFDGTPVRNLSTFYQFIGEHSEQEFTLTYERAGRPGKVMITPAEAMNLNAANSLLKVLEEPPLGSVLVLVSSQPVGLP